MKSWDKYKADIVHERFKDAVVKLMADRMPEAVLRGASDSTNSDSMAVMFDPPNAKTPVVVVVSGRELRMNDTDDRMRHLVQARVDHAVRAWEYAETQE